MHGNLVDDHHRAHAVLMTFNPEQLRQVVGAIAAMTGKASPGITQGVASVPVQDPTQPTPSPMYPLGMTVVWSEQNDVQAARITTDGATRIVYELASSKASLGEWKWQEVPLPFSINATYALAETLEAGQTAKLLEAKLLQLKASMVRIIDDPHTNDATRVAALNALHDIGEPIVPHEARADVDASQRPE